MPACHHANKFMRKNIQTLELCMLKLGGVYQSGGEALLNLIKKHSVR